MDTLLYKYKEKIKGVLEGFDRIVFKGILKPISYAAGMQSFLSRKGVLNKNYKDWTVSQSTTIIKDAEDYTRTNRGTEIQYLPSYHIRKEAAAHEHQKESGLQSGFIGTWSCLESCSTYKAVYNKSAGFQQINHAASRCKHLYFYYNHEDMDTLAKRMGEGLYLP